MVRIDFNFAWFWLLLTSNVLLKCCVYRFRYKFHTHIFGAHHGALNGFPLRIRSNSILFLSFSIQITTFNFQSVLYQMTFDIISFREDPLSYDNWVKLSSFHQVPTVISFLNCHFIKYPELYEFLDYRLVRHPVSYEFLGCHLVFWIVVWWDTHCRMSFGARVQLSFQFSRQFVKFDFQILANS